MNLQGFVLSACAATVALGGAGYATLAALHPSAPVVAAAPQVVAAVTPAAPVPQTAPAISPAPVPTPPVAAAPPVAAPRPLVRRSEPRPTRQAALPVPPLAPAPPRPAPVAAPTHEHAARAVRVGPPPSQQSDYQVYYPVQASPYGNYWYYRRVY